MIALLTTILTLDLMAQTPASADVIAYNDPATMQAAPRQDAEWTKISDLAESGRLLTKPFAGSTIGNEKRLWLRVITPSKDYVIAEAVLLVSFDCAKATYEIRDHTNYLKNDDISLALSQRLWASGPEFVKPDSNFEIAYRYACGRS